MITGIFAVVDWLARCVLNLPPLPAQAEREERQGREVGSDDCEQLRTAKPRITQPISVNITFDYQERWDLERTYGGEGGE